MANNTTKNGQCNQNENDENDIDYEFVRVAIEQIENGEYETFANADEMWKALGLIDNVE